MTTQLPAALASIKRYDFRVDETLRYCGEFYSADDIERLFATLPPPADGAVAWRWKFNDGSRSEWARIEIAPGITPSNTEIEYAYAAPPADSAMVGALQAILDDPVLDSDTQRLLRAHKAIRTLLAARK